ncbi:hypothetical protein [Streptomyces sp. NPDC020681]|uniref:hypothetical protein n=1 Tax=Streptomyces sp. NPDC020681 TaxID=3365083 RepID=UPI0037A04631
MTVHPARTPALSVARRVLRPLLVAMVLLVPLGFVSIGLWQATDDDLEFTTAERHGVIYLRPLTRLITVLGENHAIAVTGTKPEPKRLDEAIAAVSAADATVGKVLHTQGTWAELRASLSDLKAEQPVGRAAYRPYSEALDAALFLVGRVGDSSNLILDPEHAPYYLMDTAMLKLPALAADSSRMVALVALRGSERKSNELTLSRILVARDRVSSAAAGVQEGLSKSFGTYASSALGTDVLRHIDAFRGAVEDFAPVTPVITQPLPDTLEKIQLGHAELSASAAKLSDEVFLSLDQLLAERQRSLELRKWFVVAAALLGTALVVALLRWGRSPWRMTTPESTPAGPGDGAPDVPLTTPEWAAAPPPAAISQSGSRHRRAKDREAIRALR